MTSRLGLIARLITSISVVLPTSLSRSDNDAHRGRPGAPAGVEVLAGGTDTLGREALSNQSLSVAFGCRRMAEHLN